jgi:hypothetical protein
MTPTDKFQSQGFGVNPAETLNTNGFHITFENGWTVSVQFGKYNYCSNRSFTSMGETKGDTNSCPNAEIAAFDKDGTWHRGEGWDDDVYGWADPAYVLSFMNEVAALPSSVPVS